MTKKTASFGSVRVTIDGAPGTQLLLRVNGTVFAQTLTHLDENYSVNAEELLAKLRGLTQELENELAGY